MFHLHLIGLLTFQFVALTAAIFLLVYLRKQEVENWYRHVSKGIVVTLHILIIVTLIHAVIHHFHGGENMNHQQMMEEMMKMHGGGN